MQPLKFENGLVLTLSDARRVRIELEQEETQYLQDKIRTNALVDDAATIVRSILIRRGADVPTSETEEQAEVKYKLNDRLSLMAYVTVAVFVAVVVVTQPSFWKFALFFIALLITLSYLRSQREK